MTKMLLQVNGGGSVALDVLIPNTRDGGYHPHRVDVYVPAGAPVRSMVCLHGGTGNKRQQAYYMGFLLKYIPTGSFSAANVHWRWLQAFNCIAVFPQGQACAGPNMPYSVDASGNALLRWPTGGNPWNPGDINTINAQFPQGQTGWSNWFEWSGADDPQFLKDLNTWVSNTYGITHSTLSGHSSGGFMTKRAWFEFPTTFAHYITWAGPAAGYFANTPVPRALGKMLCIQGYLDQTVGCLDYYDPTISHLYDDVWLQDPTHVTRNDYAYPNRAQNHGDWPLLIARAQAAAGVTPQQSDKVVSQVHIGERWDFKYDNGNQWWVVLTGATHDFKSITQALGKGSLFISAMGWVLATLTT